MSNNLEIHLSWEDPATGELREPNLRVPIAFGREFSQMPAELQGQRVSRILLDSSEISRYHALIDWEQDQLVVIDQNSVNGIYVNANRQKRSVINSGDTLKIGPYQITLSFSLNTPIAASTPAPISAPTPTNSTIQFNPATNLPDPTLPPEPAATPLGSSFPPPIFQEEKVPVQALHATGLQVSETDYLALGGGLGSYIWADLLRIYGVSSEKIIALGLDKEPFARYKRLCLNSQIPLHERLRSNSDSCP